MNPSSKNNQFGTGQGFLHAHLKPSEEFPLRTKTSLAMWAAAVLLQADQQFGPTGLKLTSGRYTVLAVMMVASFTATAILYPRLSPRKFIVLEQCLMIYAWVATALSVAFSGGAFSPYTVMFAYAMVYSAYFFRPRTAAIQLGIGAFAMLLPFAYDTADAANIAYVQSLSVTLGVFLVMCGMVLVRRQAMLAAECRARELALTDPLTGVANLRSFDDFAAERLAECEQQGEQFGLVMIDLDGLKQANTAFGHAGGDEMIKQLAEDLLEACGRADQVTRIGGDEFAVLIHDTTAESIAQWSAGFAEIVRGHNMELTGQAPQVSASLGGACYPADGTTIAQLMDVADQRMYENKQSSTARMHQFRGDETSGARKLAAPDSEKSRQPRSLEATASGIAAVAWLMSSSMMLLSLVIPSARMGDSVSVGVLGFVSLFFGVVATVGYFRYSAVAMSISTYATMAVIAPGVLITGGPDSPLLSIAIFVSAYAAYFMVGRGAAIRIAIVLVAFSAAYWSHGSVNPADQTLFSNMIAISLVIAFVLQFNARKLAQADADAEQMALLDPLTSVSNRRAFELNLDQAIDTTDGTIGMPRPALILVDLDDFKEINTVLGHKGGDAALCATAARLRDAVGDDGSVYRIGGDEFAVIAQVTAAHRAAAISETCRAAVHFACEDLRDLGGEMPVSASFGFSVWREGFDARCLVIDADAALQKSKDSGKDAVSDAGAMLRAV